MYTDVGETTITLTWIEPAIPNGIVDNYTVNIITYNATEAHVAFILYSVLLDILYN